VFAGGVVKSNEKLTELTSLARSLLRETVESINKLKIWITFLVRLVYFKNYVLISDSSH
jgi:hypothetical protein